jgi:putative PIG3 family NAD(P)H quinone oxidoreductase
MPDMRAAVITRPGGPEVLAIQHRPRPAATDLPNGVLVRVVASALNRADLVQRAGGYPAPPGVPADIPGLEFAGLVEAVAPGVTTWQPGDRVFGLVPGGAHAEYLVTHADTLARVPDALSWADAGALPEATITAHDALRQARFVAGERVLVHAVGSGVGLAAVQLVRALGGVPIGTARTASKLAAAEALGLSAGIVPERGDDGRPVFADAVLAATDGHGADVVLDLVGGGYVGESVRCMAPRGRLVLIGLLAGRTAELDLGRVLTRRLQITGTVLRSRGHAERVAYTRAFADEVVPLIADGRVRAVVERTYGLEEIAAAHAVLGGNEVTGKVALTIAAP